MAMMFDDDPFGTGDPRRRKPTDGVTAPVSTSPFGSAVPRGTTQPPVYGAVEVPGQQAPADVPSPTPAPAAPAKHYVGAYSGVNDGFDLGKLNDPGKNTIKYQAARVFDQFDPTAYRQNPGSVIAALGKAGLNARQVGDDKIDFGDGYGPIDVVTSGGQWWWGQGGGAPSATSDGTLNALLKAMSAPAPTEQPAGDNGLSALLALLAQQPAATPTAAPVPNVTVPQAVPRAAPAPTFGGGYVETPMAPESPTAQAIQMLAMQYPELFGQSGIVARRDNGSALLQQILQSVGGGNGAPA